MRPMTRLSGLVAAASLLLASCGGGTATTGPTGAGGPGATTPSESVEPVETAAALCEDVTQAAPATDVEASVADFTWSGPVEAKIGQVITWKNNDTAAHGVKTDEPGCKMNGSIAPRQTRSLVFSQAGTFTFFCFVHSSMKGSITITE